jgi:type IV pilus assembly protein PilM
MRPRTGCIPNAWVLGDILVVSRLIKRLLSDIVIGEIESDLRDHPIPSIREGPVFGFGRQQHALLGLDISSTAVKLIELSDTAGTAAELYRVNAFTVEPLPVNAVVEKKISDVDAVGQAIQRAVARSGTKTRHAACAVAGSAVITKVVAMAAALSDAEMETQIQLEADQYIPYPLEEVNVDFDLIGPSASNPDMVDVLLAASRRENVDDRVAALELAGLTAEIVDVEAYAMENACALLLGRFDDERLDRTVAVADVGATTTTLHVLRDGTTVYTREQNFGGNQLLDEIEQRYGLSRVQALERLQQGRLPENFAPDVLGPFKESLSQQIARALQFFYSASNFNRTDQVILAGGAARIEKLDELIEERLGFPVSVANPFAAMALGPGVDASALKLAAPSMMVATGLALRAFD